MLVTISRNFGFTRQEMSLKDIKAFKSEAHKQAFEDLKRLPKSIKHILYYRDDRNPDTGEMSNVWLYVDMLPFTDDDFYKAIKSIKGYVGACHRQD